MKSLILILVLFNISSLFAATKNRKETIDRLILFEQENLEKTSPAVLSAEPEIYLENESLLRDEDTSAGIYSDLYYTKNDHLRISFAYHFSHDFEEFSKLQVIDFQVLKKIPSYKDQWWGVQVKRVVGKYSNMADELTTTSTSTDANAKTIRNANEQSMTLLGFGYGHRFRMLGDIFKSDRIFESIMAFGNIVSHLDHTDSEKYQGYGLTAEYGIQRRMSKGFFTGLKFGYNIASLERAKKSDEKKQDRSLVLQWSSIGFEFGYYF